METLGVVLGQLVNITGTEGIVNREDVPVILRNIHNLGSTSKSMYNAVNDPAVVDIFLKYLAKKQEKSLVHFVVSLDTVGTRRWIWSYIIQNKYGEAYDTIQELYKLALSVKKEIQTAGLMFDVADGRKAKPGPDPFTKQTQTGFLLYHEMLPANVATPFGKISLYGSGKVSYPLSILEAFIKRLDAIFVGVSHSTKPPTRAKYHALPIADLNDLRIKKIDEDLGKPLTTSQLENEKGQQNIIYGPHFNTISIYKIRRVGNKAVAEVTWPSEDSRVDHRLTQAMWNMLEKTRLGKDPIASEKTLSHAKPTAPEVFRALPEIYEDFFSFVRGLDAQPPREDGSKSLSIGENTSMGFALVELNEAAKHFLPMNMRWDISVNTLGWVFHKTQPDNEPCNLELFKNAYSQVLSEIGANWSKANLKNHPNILQPKSEETHQLFVRQPRFEGEVFVIDRAISAMGVQKHAHASNSWAAAPAASLPPEPRPIYLWIKKDKLALVSSLLNLREPS